MIKFIIDAQLPYSLAVMLREKGIDVTHTDDLPKKNEHPIMKFKLYLRKKILL